MLLLKGLRAPRASMLRRARGVYEQAGYRAPHRRHTCREIVPSAAKRSNPPPSYDSSGSGYRSSGPPCTALVRYQTWHERTSSAASPSWPTGRVTAIPSWPAPSGPSRYLWSACKSSPPPAGMTPSRPAPGCIGNSNPSETPAFGMRVYSATGMH